MDPAAGAGETTIARSTLEKPLSELTEEDIAQLTREDCRRFLKDRGMRRPSWNKSQAIQQVISLKALLEPPSAAEIPHKPPPPAPPVAVPPTRAEAISSDLVSPTKERPLSPYRRRDRHLPDSGEPRDTGRDPITPESIVPSPSCPSPAAGQLTIFYGGRVNVYDGVAAEKAKAIMQLASSPGFDDAPVPAEPLVPARAMPCRFVPGTYSGTATATAGRVARSFRENNRELRASRETEPDVPSSREVSLQRYLVKRKDRFKGKRALGASSPSNLEMMYFTQKVGTQTTNEQLNRGDVSSPTQPKPPGTPSRCSSMENKASKLHISVDLNKDGGDD